MSVRPVRLNAMIAWLFIVGSTCFVLGSVPAYLDAVGGTVDGVTYFVGSLFFTSASFCQLVQAQSPGTTGVDEAGQDRAAPVRLLGWEPHDRGWLAAATQFPGTLFFNVSTLAALTHNANAAESDRYVWRPDLFGSILFLVASAFGILAVSGRFLVVERTLGAVVGGVGQHARVRPVHGLGPRELCPAEHRRAREHPAVRGRNAARRRVLPRRRRPDVPGLAPGADPVPRPHPEENRMTTPLPADADAVLFGNRFATREVPSRTFPDAGMTAVDAMRLVAEDLALEGDPARNLATFVTTWMEPEAQRIIADNLHRNFIDHAEYPRTAEIEQRCIRMIADLFHAPGETTGARTQGSSEAIMLGALSLKWNWRTRRQAAGEPTTTPNLVFGGDVHVVWEKFCRYFDVEPRIVPLAPGKYTIGPEDVRPHVDENTIGVAAVLGTTFTGHKDDIVGINDLLVQIRQERGFDVPLHVDAASGGFVWPFLYPDSAWDFRLEQVRSINVSGHKFGLVYPGIGWLIFRETSDLAPDLVFEENYLGKTDATFTLNFSTGSAMVLAQYYNLVRYGRAGYGYIMRNMQENARVLADRLEAMDRFEVIGRDEEQLPLVAFRLAADEGYDEFDIAWQLSAERGWMVPAYTLPPDAQDVTIMRALVKETLSREHVDTLARDIEEACATLARKGGAHESERRKIVVGPGH